MENQVNENGTAKKNEQTVKGTNPVTADKQKTAFVHGNPVNEVSATPLRKDTAMEQPKAEQTKSVLNLAETIKVLEELHRLTVQRNKLLATIGNLEAFEVELKEDFEETEGNYYQGCILTIEDDNRKKFMTKNPLIIWTVAQNINSLCLDKLSEVEARIVIAA
jgi:hypothetical protein